ncbi:MAG: efflux RND transporter periplasmic adaptor subunit [Chromatiales bacterium]|nr:efflux RND transporter periplasmic adaptor subunit [Chromatiales bacterium]
MPTKIRNTNYLRKTMITLVAIMVLPAAIAYTSFAIENQPAPAVNNSPAPLPVVSVISVKTKTHQARLQGHGKARPHFELTLKAEVEGRITAVGPQLEIGHRIDTETVLATIDPIPFEQGVAAAKQSLAEAQLALLQEQREAERARDEWQRANLGDAKASPLLLRKPQLEAAKARLEQARAMLKQAESDLSRTRIRAPFEAIVVERHVAPGQYVKPEEAIATLYSVDRMDVRINLPVQQWSLLPDIDQLNGNDAVVLTSTNGERWFGTVSQIDQHIDNNSRQRSLVVSVANPLQQSPPLLAGTFLTAQIVGIHQGDLLAVPASSLTSTGDIWYVTDASRLAHFQARIVFQQDGTLYVQAPAGLEGDRSNRSLAVLTAPLSSYVSGQVVAPLFNNEVIL